MSYKILSCGVSKPSARILRDALVEITGKRIWVTKRTDGDGYPSIYIMRYGHCGRISPEFREGPSVGFNTPKVIEICSDKLKFSELMRKHHIYSPQFHYGVDEFDSTGRVNYPVMIRTSLQSYGGRGIMLAMNQRELEEKWQPGYYWTEFVKMPFEYRVHVLGGRIARIFKKIKEDGSDEVEFPVRNVGSGYHFSLRNASSFVQERIEPVVASVHEALQGDYYALDIGWDREHQKYFVIEANSAPGLNRVTAKVYAEYLAPLLFPS